MVGRREGGGSDKEYKLKVMTKLDKQKFDAINSIRNLCRHCRAGELHDCPVSRVISQIEEIKGVPIVVNDQLHHVLFQ